MAIFLTIVGGIWAGVKWVYETVPGHVWGYAGVGLAGFVLRGCIAILLCLSLGIAFAISPQSADSSEPPPQVLKASVRVDVPQGGGVTHHGSGTVVAAYVDRSGKPACVVLTNKHVCPTGNCPVKVRWPWDTFTSDAVWLGCDDRADLAAVACFAPADLAVCPPAAKPPAVGEIVYQVGYPRCKGPVVRKGPVLRCVSGFRADVRSAEGISTLSGDSGSGLFNAKCELVAVNWGGWGETDPRAPCHAVELADVRRFLAGRLRLAKLIPRMTDACPVHGEHCPCGCRTGSQCNCARPVAYAPAFGGNCSGGS